MGTESLDNNSRTSGRNSCFRYSSQGCSGMTLYGYARVSVREPEDKNLDLQVERLVRAGCAMGNIRQHPGRGGQRGQGRPRRSFGTPGPGGHPHRPGSHPHRPALQGTDLRTAGDRGPAPRGSGVSVLGGRFRHGHGHGQAPAPDGACLQRLVAELVPLRAKRRRGQRAVSLADGPA